MARSLRTRNLRDRFATSYNVNGCRFGGCSLREKSEFCDNHHISFLESALLMLREDGGCYAKSTLPSRCWHTSPRRHDRLCGRWSEDIPGQKPLLCRRPGQWNRDSSACEHEKLSDGVVAAVNLLPLTFS